MNPAQRQVESEGCAFSNNPTGEICWALPFSQQIFAMRTDDTKLLEMAANVFRPWLSTADRSRVSHHWYIESTDSRREQNFAQPASWRISSNLNTEVIEQESRERALMMVEYL